MSKTLAELCVEIDSLDRRIADMEGRSTVEAFSDTQFEIYLSLIRRRDAVYEELERRHRADGTR